MRLNILQHRTAPTAKSYPVPNGNSDAIEKACSRKMKEEMVAVIRLFLADSLLYLAFHKHHDLHRLQSFIITPSVQGRKSVSTSHGLSKTKRLGNAELGLRPRSNSKVRGPNQHAISNRNLGCTHAAKKVDSGTEGFGGTKEGSL